MSSGIKIADEVKETYQQISMTSTKSTKLKYCILKFSDDSKRIIVEKSASAEEDSDYDTIISGLPPKDVRYLAYDFEFVNKDGTKKSEMILVSWHPETSPIKQKMLCASSFNALKSCLSVSKNVIEGSCFEEVSSAAVLEKLRRN
ncbi:unnamed protein product [Lymnaea stagnalis]|uniref:ADF-H domain-containing protein n=1 Tax=Lymnaea stagnalis TaxID=6523 RepID=A0AAV2HSI8_LYMST